MNEYDSEKDTITHIHRVIAYVEEFMRHLKTQTITHDYSKLRSPEKETFDRVTPLLKSSVYGSEEYKKCTSSMSEALKHHYKNNRHHPEHHADGVCGMTLVDIVEMFCDWCAATERHETGNILKSLEINSKRFDFSDDLKQILINTVNKYKMGKLDN